MGWRWQAQAALLVLMCCMVTAARTSTRLRKQKEPGKRGQYLFCNIQYDAPRSAPKQFLIETHKVGPVDKMTASTTAQWQDEYNRLQQFLECFSGGRGPHRTAMIETSYASDMSQDWGVTMRTERSNTATTLMATNARDEDVFINVRVTG